MLEQNFYGVNYQRRVYTDGVTEAVNPRNEFYGEKRLIETMQKFKNNNNSKEIVKYLKNNVYEFYEDREQSDDLTLVALVYY